MLELLLERANNFQLVSRLVGVREAASAYTVNLWKRSRPATSADIQEFHVRGVPSPLRYRAGSSDWRVFLQIFAKQEYEVPSVEHAKAVQSAYETMLGRNVTPVIVDCGANIGLASVWYALKYPMARIYAVEPEPGNFAILQTNCAPFPNITPVQAAISDRNESVTLANDTREPWAWQTIADGSGDIQCVTIPDLLSRTEGGVLFICKVDIEGFETELFRSGTEWADTAPLVVFESHDGLFPWRGTAHAILAVLARRRREYLQHGENTFAILDTAHPHADAAGETG